MMIDVVIVDIAMGHVVQLKIHCYLNLQLWPAPNGKRMRIPSTDVIAKPCVDENACLFRYPYREGT